MTKYMIYIKLNRGPARYYIGAGTDCHLVSNVALAKTFSSQKAAYDHYMVVKELLDDFEIVSWGTESIKKPIYLPPDAIAVATNLGELLKHVPQQGDSSPTFIRNRINDCAYIRAQLELALKSAGYQP
jgi:hypothetical protein